MNEPPSEPTERRARDERVQRFERPGGALLASYAIHSLAGLFLAPVIFVPLFFKYHTLRYRIDEQGISASWGILFRRETYLTYERIQDIHVKRNLVERWLGIARVELQTASGSSTAELTLEGVGDWIGTRDYLYERMRGQERAAAAPADAGTGAHEEQVLCLLREIRAELAAARAALESGR